MGSGLWGMSAWDFIKAGGPLLIPILLCSFFALGIFIEKISYFASIKTDVVLLKKRVFDLIKNNQIIEAIKLCESDRSAVAKILKAGLLKFGSSREDIKESIEAVSLLEIPKLEIRLGALATIAHISPLLGLLGTVAGMTSIFHTIQIRAASLNPVTSGDLAGGIYEALLTTIAGLMVAIPAFIAYNYCIARTNHIILEMERVATELVNLMHHISEANSGAQVIE